MLELYNSELVCNDNMYIFEMTNPDIASFFSFEPFKTDFYAGKMYLQYNVRNL
jgi:hypothetical protein